ncbi:hypothetical protein [Halosimplex marinum]|uniref:hypothetical protein n=1 Tax=Halosimplex marinum TaxID=3396620 RepID=UPI003F570BE9
MHTDSTADRSVRTTAGGEPPAQGERKGKGDGDERATDGGDNPSVRRPTRIMRLVKLAATTLAALAGAAKAIGLV